MKRFAIIGFPLLLAACASTTPIDVIDRATCLSELAIPDGFDFSTVPAPDSDLFQLYIEVQECLALDQHVEAGSVEVHSAN